MLHGYRISRDIADRRPTGGVENTAKRGANAGQEVGRNLPILFSYVSLSAKVPTFKPLPNVKSPQKD